ncbi:transposase [Enhygromyxa salina]|uniref:transposase n=1 Tax=Enhygromyxa salina TaxID=215803 RepID=UPI0015E66CFE|nr:transposase [Enhygromyxa salina]
MPNEQVTETIQFILADACSKHDVSLHEVVYMSNHFHILLTAHSRCLPDFMRDLNSVTSRALNALRGTKGTNVEKGYGLVEPQDDEKVLEHAVYTLANPCASDLVTRARHWKGVTTTRMRYGEEIVLKKPRYGIWARKKQGEKRKQRKRPDARMASKRDRSTIQKYATLKLVRPPIMPELSDDELRDLVLERVGIRENELEEKRQTAGKKVVKMRNVKKYHWSTMLRATELFGLRPTVSASDKETRLEALRRNKEFQRAYAEARERWLQGEKDVEFPAGTWLMCRRYGARCAGCS